MKIYESKMSLVNNVESELDSRDARLDFENVLQEVLEKANAEDRIPSEKEEEKDSSNEDGTKEQKSTVSSPQKPSTPRSGKKRKKRDEQKDDAQKASPYVMKLFDRSVDLAPFTDETPLYPICRAWMENDPLKKNAHQQSNGVNHGELRIEADSPGDDDGAVIRKMLRPNKSWKNVNKKGKYRSPWVPTPLTPSDNDFDKFVASKSEPPTKDALLSNHVPHWKKVRQTWKAKSIENEERYKDGMNLLLDMFYRSTNSQ